jgi:hypothetical protein
MNASMIVKKNFERSRSVSLRLTIITTMERERVTPFRVLLCAVLTFSREEEPPVAVAVEDEAAEPSSRTGKKTSWTCQSIRINKSVCASLEVEKVVSFLRFCCHSLCWLQLRWLTVSDGSGGNTEGVWSANESCTGQCGGATKRYSQSWSETNEQTQRMGLYSIRQGVLDWLFVVGPRLCWFRRLMA